MWLDKQVSLYASHFDNFGKSASLREILLCEFARDLPTLIALRKLDRSDSKYLENKRHLKNKLQCYTPAGLLSTKAKSETSVISPTGLMQFDFDNSSIGKFDLEEIKKGVFSLPFIAFCGLSCSGDGFYALALIAEPQKLAEYAEHCFQAFSRLGIMPDRSKGKRVEDLRYVSYDPNMLIRDHPEPLLIKRFNNPKTRPPRNKTALKAKTSPDGLAKWAEMQIRNATVGNRFFTIRKVCYTLGGLKDNATFSVVTQIIKTGTQYQGCELEFIKCAENCFREGLKKPL